MDTTLSQAKFAYNNMQNCSIGTWPFDVVYTHPPCLTFDLTTFPSFVDLSYEAIVMVDRVQKIHTKVVEHLEVANKNYKTMVLIEVQ